MKTSYGDYQTESRKTWSYVHTHDHQILYPLLGLSNEVGELMGKIKKIFRDDAGTFTPEKKDELMGELGDILWYFTQICTDLDIRIDDVAEKNLQKLFSRQQRGVLGGSGDTR